MYLRGLTLASFFITTTAKATLVYPWAHANYVRVMKAAEASVGKGYTIANHPQDADIIVFVEPGCRFQNDVLASPLFLAFPQKSVVLDFNDRPFPVLPGLYSGLTAHQSNETFQGNAYIRVADNNQIDLVRENHVPPDLLFSFVGRASNYPIVRNALLKLKHPHSILNDQSSNQSDGDIGYIKTLCRSKFVLCPRGFGPSSWRLFETMRAGRVPVIISDDWVPPKDLLWDKFSIRVAETDVERIADILSDRESEHQHMGNIARTEWNNKFSYAGFFPWVAKRLEEVVSASIRENRSLTKYSVFSKAVSAGLGVRFVVEYARVAIGR